MAGSGWTMMIIVGCHSPQYGDDDVDDVIAVVCKVAEVY